MRSLADSATLVGPQSTITTGTLDWNAGVIQASLVVELSAQLLAAPEGGPILSNAATTQGAPPATFTNNGAAVQTGTLSLTPGANAGPQVVNHGQWTATGVSTISSTNC